MVKCKISKPPQPNEDYWDVPFGDCKKAKLMAKELRKEGYDARVVVEGTNIHKTRCVCGVAVKKVKKGETI